MKDKYLVLITAGQMQLCAIDAAKRIGIKTIAFDGDPQAPGLKKADIGIHCDINDCQAVINSIKEYCESPLAGALSMCSEAGMMTAAQVRKYFGLKGPSIELTTRLVNKNLQRSCWDSAGLPNPQWSVAKTTQEALTVAKKIGFPLIVKPTDSAGSRGVNKVAAKEELLPAISAAFTNSKSGLILCERFFVGKEYTVETFSIDGKHYVITTTEKEKVPTSNGTVASTIHTTGINGPLLKKINKTAQDSLSALGYTSGVGHTELIFNEHGDGILVETAGRGAGFMLFEKFQKMTSGFDAVLACVQDAVGIKPALPLELRNTPCVLSFFPSSPGVLREINGLDKIVQDERLQIGLFSSIGQKTVAACTGDQARLGYALAADSTLRAAKAKIEGVRQKVQFIITD